MTTGFSDPFGGIPGITGAGTQAVSGAPSSGVFNTNTSSPTYTNYINQLAMISGLYSGLQQTETQATGQATAATTAATGYGKEAASYQTAADIANENAKIAGIAGDLAVFQQQREVARTAGAAAAAAGASGVTQSGSVSDVLASTYTQGAIGTQVLTVQSALEVGGYEEAAAASEALVAGAQAQQDAATQEAAAYSAQASQAASQIANLQKQYAPALKTIDQMTVDPLETPPLPFGTVDPALATSPIDAVPFNIQLAMAPKVAG